MEGALRAGLEPIVCVGETQQQRDAGQAIAVVREQLQGSLPQGLRGRAFAVAYEPVWAIGTGRIPTEAEIAEVHAAVRADLREQFGEQGGAPPILYGGSVNAANACERAPHPGGRRRAGGGRLPQGGGLQPDPRRDVSRWPPSACGDRTRGFARRAVLPARPLGPISRPCSPVSCSSSTSWCASR